MRFDVIKLVLKEEKMGNKEEIIRNILSFFLLGIFFIKFIMPYINMNFKSGKNILIGIVVITFYYAVTFTYSILKSKRIFLYKLLPFKSSNIFFSYMIVMITNGILKRIVVFLLPVYIYTMSNNFSNTGFLILDFIKINLITVIALFLSIIFALEVFNHKIIVPILMIALGTLLFRGEFYDHISLILIADIISCALTYYFFNKDFKFISSNKSTYSKSKTSFIKREFIRFFGEKILVINHIVTLVMIFVFTFIYIISQKKIDFASYLILIMPSMITTSSIMFSIEKDSEQLLKMLPLNEKKFFIDKYIFLLIITIPFYIITFAILVIQNVVGFNFMSGALIIVNLLINCFVKMYLDYSNPFYEYSHVKQLMENNRRYYFYLISIVFGIPIITVNFIGIGFAFLIQIMLFVIFMVIIRARGKALVKNN